MTWRQLVIIAIVVIAVIFLKWSGIFYYLSLPSMQEYADTVAVFVEKSYILSVFYFIIFYTFIILLAIPGFAPMTMISGYLFGTVAGAVYALCGSFVGSIISYMTVKMYLRGYIIHNYADKIQFFTRYVHRYGIANALLLLHFLTIIPFFLINSFAAISGISTITFIWTTIAGSLPLVILYAYAGQKLHEINKMSDIFSLPIIIIFVVLISFALFPMIFRYFNQKKE